MGRISRDSMLMGMAMLAALRSTCERKHVGAVLARNGRVLSIGYSGAPSGLPHCSDVGCLIDPATGGCIRTQHAEANAIAFAAREGILTGGSILYTTLSPCLPCAKLIINAGIDLVIYREEYRDRAGIECLHKSSVFTEQLSFPFAFVPDAP